MKTILRFRPLASLLLLSAGVAVAQEPTPVKEVVIDAGETLKFSVTHIEAAPGQKVHLLLKNDGSLPKAVMAHNWVLLKSGNDANRYSMAATSAAAEGYQPKALGDEVIATIPLLGPHQSADVTFTAPMTPGRYEFLCSFPAHCAAGMRGELIVR